MITTIILGEKTDYHACYMLDAALKLGIDAVLFETSSFPCQSLISWQPGQNTGYIQTAQRRVEFQDIHSVFWSTAGYGKRDLQQLEFNSAIALNDSTSMLKTFFLDSDIRWCNSWHAVQFHKVKPRQLDLASKLGLDIPLTYMGNDCEQLKTFVYEQPQTIFKPVFGGAHCTKVEKAHLRDEHLQRVLKLSPVTIQEYIPGTNVRTFVIGRNVFSALLNSDELDYRMEAKLEIVPTELPVDLEDKAIRLTREFGMNWTAIDWRRTPEGKFYFLEANPSPMFIHFEQVTGFPITKCLLELLAD